MEKTLRQTTIKISKETLLILVTVAGAVILPQILHTAGVALGVGGKLGQIFLPMYLPVLIIGFYRGPVSGAVAGLLAPVVSFMLTAMPQQEMLPYITVELISTGLFAGLLSGVRLPAYLRVFIVQVLAKAVRLAAFAAAFWYAGNSGLTASVLFAGIVQSLPGVVLQIVIITCLLKKSERKI